ncbi:bifunctional glycosyltransferase family 2/GtrA family protein [uncultured Clostridium sp.]|uniref:bifunctional glycosyltransferase family 2/GtrA family protein n=1 Tax=uncultured Clostridium sp. TaxID=59620 RepID=UPI0026255D5C|nr:bifunctional glycosyltransferase family 2/GtrA family protein [uncultured Clostridium sp.]
MVILIPAYKPDEKLIELIKNIKEKCDYKIVIVDDGSGIEYAEIFKKAEKQGCYIVTHEENRGKGRALKTGFNYIKNLNDIQGIVCADCDGQHLPKDIIKIGNAIKLHKDCIILGSRKFTGKVPLRSKLGNTVTRGLFTIISGIKIHDTQTGLRGFSIDMIQWLTEIKGERYEYEMNMLLEAKSLNYGFIEIDIETVYLEENKSSHFNPVKDSIAIYLPIIKFSISSIISATIDYVLLGVILLMTKNLFLAVVGARLCSATFNYLANRLVVFNKNNKDKMYKSLWKYALLAAFIMLLNYVVIYFYINELKLNLYVAKVLTEVTIYFFSYTAQKRFVFRR